MRFEGGFVFTYCHVDGSPIWDGSSAMPESAVTSSYRSRDVSRGKHFNWVEAGQIWNIHMDVWSNIPGACLRGYLDISRVFYTTQWSQMWPLCRRPARHSHSNQPGTHATVWALRIMAFSFWGSGLFIWDMPTGSLIAGHWFILISHGEQFRWVWVWLTPFSKH